MTTWTDTKRGLGIFWAPLYWGARRETPQDLTSPIDKRADGTDMDPLTRSELLAEVDEVYSRMNQFGDSDYGTYAVRLRRFPSVIPMRMSIWPSGLAPQGNEFPDDIANRIRWRGGHIFLNLPPDKGSRTDGKGIQAVLDGDHDSTFIQLGEDIADWQATQPSGNNLKGVAYNSIVILKLGPECNGKWHQSGSYGIYTAAEFRQAHTRFVDKVRQGITNKSGNLSHTKFMLHMMDTPGGQSKPEYDKGSMPWDDFFDFDADSLDANDYIDIVGISSYDTTRGTGSTPWIPHPGGYVTQQAVQWLEDDVQGTNHPNPFNEDPCPDAPVWLAEYGTDQPDFTGLSSSEIADLREEHQEKFLQKGINKIRQDSSLNRVKCMIYFDLKVGGSTPRDWRLAGTNYDHPAQNQKKNLRPRYGKYVGMTDLQASSAQGAQWGNGLFYK